jgi:hypothetical protein
VPAPQRGTSTCSPLPLFQWMPQTLPRLQRIRTFAVVHGGNRSGFFAVAFAGRGANRSRAQRWAGRLPDADPASLEVISGFDFLGIKWLILFGSPGFRQKLVRRCSPLFENIDGKPLFTGITYSAMFFAVRPYPEYGCG